MRIVVSVLALLSVGSSLFADCRFYGYSQAYAVPLVGSYTQYAAVAPSYGYSYQPGYNVFSGYGNYGYTPSYSGGCGFNGYGHSGSSYSPDVGGRYSSGKSYWAGGYYGGGYGYKAGYYAPGYYDNYSPSYQKVNYTPPVHIVEPVFYKFDALLPVAQLPTYGSYFLNPTANGPLGYNSGTVPAGSAPYNPPAASHSTAPSYAGGAAASYSMDSKIDRLLALATDTSRELGSLKSRVGVLESVISPGRVVPPSVAPVSPVPTPGPGTGSPPVEPRPAPPREDPTPAPRVTPDKPDVPSLMFNKCATCHESKTAGKLGGNRVYFVVGDMGAEMAKYGPGGKVVPLAVTDLKGIVKALREGTMPPKEGTDGKPTPVERMLTDAQRKEAVEFFEGAITSGGPK